VVSQKFSDFGQSLAGSAHYLVESCDAPEIVSVFFLARFEFKLAPVCQENFRRQIGSMNANYLNFLIVVVRTEDIDHRFFEGQRSAQSALFPRAVGGSRSIPYGTGFFGAVLDVLCRQHRCYENANRLRGKKCSAPWAAPRHTLQYLLFNKRTLPLVNRMRVQP